MIMIDMDMTQDIMEMKEEINLEGMKYEEIDHEDYVQDYISNCNKE